MANGIERQYVGARYVPVFFNNPDGTWDWAQGFQYEPLTIVKYGENTYTSKMLVPSNVGAPNLNPEYWAVTGNYNGAINELTKQINDISTIQSSILLTDSPSIVYLGDSWLDDNTDPDGIPKAIQNLNGLPYYNLAVSGSKITDGLKQQAQNLVNATYINKNKIAMIIIICGLNDYRNNISGNSVASSLKQIETLLDEAGIRCPIYLYVDYTLESNELSKFAAQNTFLLTIMNNYAGRIAINSCMGMVAYQSFEASGLYYHPNSNGHKQLALSIWWEIMRYKHFSYPLFSYSQTIAGGVLEILAFIKDNLIYVETKFPLNYIYRDSLFEATINLRYNPFSGDIILSPNAYIGIADNKLHIYEITTTIPTEAIPLTVVYKNTYID